MRNLQPAFKWLIGSFICMILFLFTGYFLARKYEAPVTQYIVSEINKQLIAPVHVSDINFSLLQRFPSASLIMDHVWAEEVSTMKSEKLDTLFYFDKIYLDLNIFEILRGKYSMKSISAERGFLNLHIDKEGKENYRIWKPQSDSNGFLLELKHVSLANTKIDFENQYQKQRMTVEVDDVGFSGILSSSLFTLEMKGNGVWNSFFLDGRRYLNSQEFELNLVADIDTDKELYSFKESSVEIDNRLNFALSGDVNEDSINIELTGLNLDIVEAMALIPFDDTQWIKDYRSEGVFDFKCTMKGPWGKKRIPRLKIDFRLEDVTISKMALPWKISRLNGSGHFDNGKQREKGSTELSMNIHGKFNDQPFSSEFQVYNFNAPSLSGTVDVRAKLNALKEFLNIEYLESGSGDMTIQGKFSTTLLNPESASARDFFNSRVDVFIQVTDAHFRLKDDFRDYTIQTAIAHIKDDKLIIENYEGEINDCHVLMNGQAENFLEYVFSDIQKINISGNLKLGSVDMESLFPVSAEDGVGGPFLPFTDRSNWALSISIDSFSTKKFSASTVSGNLYANDFRVEASALSFQSTQGVVNGMIGVYKYDDNQLGWKTDFKATHVDVSELFKTFDNFRQNFITYDQLKGFSDAQVQSRFLTDSLLNIDINSLIVHSELTVTDGELINFEPLIAVADQMKKKKSISLFVDTDELRSRLKEVKFASLRNEISIRDGVVYIPKMDIRSSAVDLSVLGTHSFDNEIHYELEFSLSELLDLKNRTEPYNEFVQRDQNGRTKLVLRMDGTTDDFEVELEKQSLRKAIREEMRVERRATQEALKTGIHEAVAPKEEAEPNRIQIEFDPEAGTRSSAKDPAKDSANIQKPKRRSSGNRKKLEEGNFEDDDF